MDAVRELRRGARRHRDAAVRRKVHVAVRAHQVGGEAAARHDDRVGAEGFGGRSQRRVVLDHRRAVFQRPQQRAAAGRLKLQEAFASADDTREVRLAGIEGRDGEDDAEAPLAQVDHGAILEVDRDALHVDAHGRAREFQAREGRRDDVAEVDGGAAAHGGEVARVEHERISLVQPADRRNPRVVGRRGRAEDVHRLLGGLRRQRQDSNRQQRKNLGFHGMVSFCLVL